MNLALEGKIIIVSGGARGIGEGITNLLAAEGAIPVIIGRSEENNIALVKAIQMQGYQADHVVAELTEPAACENAINKIVAKFSKIDGLVNNAGENDSIGLENGNYALFMKSLHKNLVHYYLLTHHALPYLKKSKGSIVNISSKTAETGQGGTSAYAASNGGRNALTREWAVELLPYGIRVNAVVVAECYTPLYEKWIKTLPNPEEKLNSIKAKIPLGQTGCCNQQLTKSAAQPGWQGIEKRTAKHLQGKYRAAVSLRLAG